MRIEAVTTCRPGRCRARGRAVTSRPVRTAVGIVVARQAAGVRRIGSSRGCGADPRRRAPRPEGRTNRRSSSNRAGMAAVDLEGRRQRITRTDLRRVACTTPRRTTAATGEVAEAGVTVRLWLLIRLGRLTKATTVVAVAAGLEACLVAHGRVVYPAGRGGGEDISGFGFERHTELQCYVEPRFSGWLTAR